MLPGHHPLLGAPSTKAWNNGADGRLRDARTWPTTAKRPRPATMAYYEREDIPFYWSLAENFTICDNYYCSVIGPTYPNRLYSMSAHARPRTAKTVGRSSRRSSTSISSRAASPGRRCPSSSRPRVSRGRSTTATNSAPRTTCSNSSKTSKPTPQLKKLGLDPRLPHGLHRPTSSTTNCRRSPGSTPHSQQTEHPGNSSATGRRVRRSQNVHQVRCTNTKSGTRPRCS